MSLLSSVGGLQQELATRLNEVSATEADVYLTWINLTAQDIATQYQLGRWLETSANMTVSSGTRTYPLSGNFVSMYSVYDESNGYKLSYVTKQEWDSLHISSNQGNPTRYTINIENIEFDPTPGSSITYRYEYRKTLGSVSASTQTVSAIIGTPDRYAEMYVFKGMQYGLERRGDYQQGQYYEKKYQEMLQRMINELKDTGIKRIKSAREFRPNTTTDPIKNIFWNS